MDATEVGGETDETQNKSKQNTRNTANKLRSLLHAPVLSTPLILPRPTMK